MTDLKLPKFKSVNELAWPLPRPPIAVEMAMHVAAITRHPGADWHKSIEARNRAAAEESRERAARQVAERAQHFKEQMLVLDRPAAVPVGRGTASNSRQPARMLRPVAGTC